VNPSGDVAAYLSGRCIHYTDTWKQKQQKLHVCFDGVVLPVNSTGSCHVAKLLSSHAGDASDFPYQAILHLGVEDVAKGLKLETFAINHLAEELVKTSPDNSSDSSDSNDSSDSSGNVLSLPAHPSTVALRSCLGNNDADTPQGIDSI
jgi:hypothetical protein